MIAYIKEKKITGLNYIQNENSGGGSGDCDLDFGAIGLETPKSLQDNFNYAKEIYDNWDASITNRSNAFSSDKQLVYFPAVDTSNVTNMNKMFNNCYNLQVVPTIVNTSQVTDMGYMFFYCSGLTSLDLSGWNTSNVTNMNYIFSNCRGLTSLDLSGWDTSNVTNMQSMFYICNKLTSLDLSSFDTSNVTDMSYMFYHCSGLTSLDVSNFDTSNVITMYRMFEECSGLTSLDLSGWDTSNVTNMSYMFNYCSGLTSLDLSGWDTSNVTNMQNMFYYCRKLQKIDGYIDWSKQSSYPSSFFTSYSPYPLRYMTIKNIGKTGTTFNLSDVSLQNWGDETDTTTYPLSVGARQTLVDSLVTYTHDRATAGMSTCTIKLHANTQTRLTEDEIAQITAKGYTIA